MRLQPASFSRCRATGRRSLRIPLRSPLPRASSPGGAPTSGATLKSHPDLQVLLRRVVGARDSDRDLDARADVQLAEDVAEMRFDRFLAEEQLGGDLRVGFALRDESSELQLARRQRLETRRIRTSAACAPIRAVAEPS